MTVIAETRLALKMNRVLGKRELVEQLKIKVLNGIHKDS